jgi:hypothetical protein
MACHAGGRGFESRRPPIGPTNGGFWSGPPVAIQLLLQRQVLENQTAVSARQNDQEPNSVDESGDHRCSITGSAHMAEAA